MILALYSVYDGFLDAGRSWSDQAVWDYIMKQIDEFGRANLTAIAGEENSLLLLGQKFWAATIYTYGDLANYGTKNSLRDNLFWIDYYWNNSVVDSYKQARQFWIDNNLDSVVVGKNASEALNSLVTWIDGNLNSASGTPALISNFTNFYENYVDKIYQGYKVPMDCEGESTFAVYLIRAQNHLYIENDLVTNAPTSSRFPFTALQVLVPNHAGTASLVRDDTTGDIYVELESGTWTILKADKTEMDLQIPAAFWYEIISPEGINLHNFEGERHVDMLNYYLWKPYYDVPSIGADNVSLRTDYSLMIDKVIKSQDGAIKRAWGTNFKVPNAPFRRNVYDLLYRDYPIGIPEFSDMMIPTAATLLIGLYARRAARRKREED